MLTAEERLQRLEALARRIALGDAAPDVVAEAREIAASDPNPDLRAARAWFAEKWSGDTAMGACEVGIWDSSHPIQAYLAGIAHGRATPVKANDDGWIEWHGGECPVAGDTLVEVIFRSGNKQAARANAFWWKRSPMRPSDDIVAYRLV